MPSFVIHGAAAKPLCTRIRVVLVVLEAEQAIAFLNAELKRLEKPPIATEPVVDTLVLARRKAPRRTEHSIVVGVVMYNDRFAQQPAPRSEPIYYCATGVEIPLYEPCTEMKGQRDI